MHRTILSTTIQLHCSLYYDRDTTILQYRYAWHGRAEPVRHVLNFRYRTGINFSNLRTVDCSPKRSKSMRNDFVRALLEKPALDFLGGFVRSSQMHRSRRSLKDPEGEQDATVGRPNASLNFVTNYLLTVLTVYPELTPGKQYVTF